MERTLTLAAVAFVLAGLAAGPSHAEAIKFRIALDTGPAHVRNIAVEQFVAAVKAKAGSQIAMEVFPNGQLYKGPDEPRALARGDLDMAVPGLWQLDKVEANAIITTLPSFAGLSPEQLTRLVDGPVAGDLNKRFESKLRVHVLGRYLALGYAHTYSATKPIRTMEDMRGMKVRIPGGAAILALFKSRGANPVVIPWADVPLALSQGTIDALQSSDETIRSGKMWDAGLKHAFADGGVYLHYIPMVAKPSWDKLGPALQKTVAEAWESIVDAQRRLAETRQAEAREENKRNGITYVIPTDAELQRARLAAAAQTDEVVKSMELDPDLLRKAKASVGLGS